MNDTNQEAVEHEDEMVFEIITEAGEKASYKMIMAAIETLDKETEGLTIIEDDNKSYDLVKSKRLIVKKLRTTVENRRKDLNKDAQKIISARNAAASKIKDKIEPVESRLKALETAEDNRRAMKEQARVDTIQNRVKLIQAATQGIASMRSERITKLIQGVRDVEITEADYQEMMPQAESAKITALEELGKALIAAKESETAEIKRVAEEKALKEKNEILEAQAKKDAEEKAILEKKLEEERLAREVQEKELAEKDAAAKAEQDKKDEEAAAEKAELEAKVKAMEQASKDEKEATESELGVPLEEPEPEPEPQKELGVTALEHMDAMNPEPDHLDNIRSTAVEMISKVLSYCESRAKAIPNPSCSEDQYDYEFHSAVWGDMEEALQNCFSFDLESVVDHVIVDRPDDDGPEVRI
jgi:hypothetical protein